MRHRAAVLPGIGRLGILRPLGLDRIVPAATLLLVALALVGPLYDLIRRRRVHPAYVWGVGAIVAAHLLHPVVAGIAPMQSLAARLTPPG